MKYMAIAISGLVLSCAMTALWFDPDMIQYRNYIGVGALIGAFLVGLPAGLAEK